MNAKTFLIILLCLLATTGILWTISAVRRKLNKDAGFILHKNLPQHERACMRFNVYLAVERVYLLGESEADMLFRFDTTTGSYVLPPAKTLDLVRRAHKGDGTFVDDLKKYQQRK